MTQDKPKMGKPQQDGPANWQEPRRILTFVWIDIVDAKDSQKPIINLKMACWAPMMMFFGGSN